MKHLMHPSKRYVPMQRDIMAGGDVLVFIRGRIANYDQLSHRPSVMYGTDMFIKFYMLHAHGI